MNDTKLEKQDKILGVHAESQMKLKGRFRNGPIKAALGKYDLGNKYIPKKEKSSFID